MVEGRGLLLQAQTIDTQTISRLFKQKNEARPSSTYFGRQLFSVAIEAERDALVYRQKKGALGAFFYQS